MHSIILFDVDETLTQSRKRMTDGVSATLQRLSDIPRLDLGVVSGLDYKNLIRQLGEENMSLFKYIFSENGLVAYKDEILFHEMKIIKYLGEKNNTQLINYLLKYVLELDVPIKRGTFIEYRTGLINICPIGRNCTQDERMAFNKYDKVNGIRKKLAIDIVENFGHLGIQCSIGGQISVDMFPIGWDKTYCLKLIGDYEKIYFFGDSIHVGGNDYELYNHSDVVGHGVTCPDDTVEYVTEMFLSPALPTTV